MSVINKILDNPFMWDLSQAIFGCNAKKKQVYRSLIKERGRILDFGCADGNTFSAFEDFEYYGVDINKKLIDHAIRKYAHHRNAHFISADILDNTFQEGFFDHVLFAITGHHLPDDDLLKIMRALSRVLKSNGSLYFIDTIKDPKRKNPLLNLLINLDQGKFMRNQEKYNQMIHEFSPELIPFETKVFLMRGTFMPQPTYYYTEFRKK